MNIKKLLSCFVLAFAIFTGCQVIGPANAEAADVWIDSRYGNEYYVITESVHKNADEDWFAKVKVVKNGQLQHLNQYRFIPVDDYVTVNFWFSNGWEYLGKTYNNEFAALLWNRAVVPYM